MPHMLPFSAAAGFSRSTAQSRYGVKMRNGGRLLDAPTMVLCDFLSTCSYLSNRRGGYQPPAKAAETWIAILWHNPTPPLCKGRWHGSSRDGGIDSLTQAVDSSVSNFPHHFGKAIPQAASHPAPLSSKCGNAFSKCRKRRFSTASRFFLSKSGRHPIWVAERWEPLVRCFPKVLPKPLPDVGYGGRLLDAPTGAMQPLCCRRGGYQPPAKATESKCEKPTCVQDAGRFSALWSFPFFRRFSALYRLV